MVELLSVQKVILYDGQERTRSAPAQAQLPAQFQVQQLQAEAQTEPESLAVNPAEAGEGTGKRPYDEYSEEPPKTPIGLYRLISDEEGEPAVEFDDPEEIRRRSPPRIRAKPPPAPRMWTGKLRSSRPCGSG